MNEVIDSLILDCNNIVRTIMAGNYVSWCSQTVDLVRNLEMLKTQVNEELEKKNKKIEELKSQLNNLGSTKKDGAE